MMIQEWKEKIDRGIQETHSLLSAKESYQLLNDWKLDHEIQSLSNLDNPYQLTDNQQEILYSCLYQYLENLADSPRDVLEDVWTDNTKENVKLVNQECDDTIDIVRKVIPEKAKQFLIDNKK